MLTPSRRVGLLWAGICLAVCRPVWAAPSSESISARAGAIFMETACGENPRFVQGGQQGEEAAGRPVNGAGNAELNPIDRFLMGHTNVLLQQGQTAPAASGAAVKEMDLAPLLNRHLKTSLKYSLGGKDVWISGAFDRSQNAYISVLEDGKEARFFNVKDLLTNPQVLEIGTGKYKLSLSPDLSDQLESEVVLTNMADKKDKQRVTLREMFAAITAAAEEIKLTGQTYRFFYMEDIKDGKADKTSKSFAFILTDAQGEIHIFLVPSELVPSDKIAVFKMYEDKRVGLQESGGKLKVYENP